MQACKRICVVIQRNRIQQLCPEHRRKRCEYMKRASVSVWNQYICGVCICMRSQYTFSCMCTCAICKCTALCTHASASNISHAEDAPDTIHWYTRRHRTHARQTVRQIRVRRLLKLHAAYVAWRVRPAPHQHGPWHTQTRQILTISAPDGVPMPMLSDAYTTANTRKHAGTSNVRWEYYVVLR